MRFEIELPDNKKLIFDSELDGLKIDGTEYLAGKDGVLIYDQASNLTAESVRLQMSTNTSTLIPALKILGLDYNPYFDQREVLDSQNDITFYWHKSKLAAYYNRFSTDDLDFAQREPVIPQAVTFLTTNPEKLNLGKELLTSVAEPCQLLGFYQGFPIFDSSTGFAKLQSRLGIHLDPDGVMISTPLSKYENDVYELAETIKKETGLDYSKKKNRVVFSKDNKLFDLLNIEDK